MCCVFIKLEQALYIYLNATFIFFVVHRKDNKEEETMMGGKERKRKCLLVQFENPKC